MAPKTLLLVFIHGFKGGEETFGQDKSFTNVLRDIVAVDLPDVSVKVLVYPKYETRGNLGECVGRFRDWLQEKVIDLEVAAGTPSPTIEPSVHTILIGHSMGGIVAAETVIALTSDKPILQRAAATTDDDTECTTGATGADVPFSNIMFPYIQGVLAFDTPFLGLSPGIVAHGAEEKYITASTFATQLGSLWNRNAAAATSAASAIRGALPASTTQSTPSTTAAAATAAAAAMSAGGNRWGSWGKIALAAGGAAVVAAGAGAAWYNRNNITTGFNWVGSHLEFVGVLGKADELQKRVTYMARLQRERGIGFVNMYTLLGHGAGQNNIASLLYSKQRTFCVLPSGKFESGVWAEARNDKAGDEIMAHIGMFESDQNPGYDDLVSGASDFIAEMVRTTVWYESINQQKLKR